MMGSGMILSNNFKFFPMTTTSNDQLAAGTDLPASGSYVNIGNCERYHILLRWGAIDASDTPVVEPKQAEAADGTLDAISQTDLRHTAAADDDNEYVTWTIETRKHTKAHDYAALDVISGVTNGTYADAVLLKEEFQLPVTQTTSVLPSASQHYYCG